MKNLVSIFIAFIFTLQLSAASIKGNINSIGNMPIAYANIIIMTTDSVMVSGTISDENGKFEIYNIDKGDYIVKASFIGYNPFYKDVKVNDNLYLPIVLEEDTNLLSEITITAKKELIKGTPKGIIANVGTTLLGTLGSAQDVLTRLPGVVLDKDNLQVLGKGEPVVYINKRKLNSLSELTSLQSEDISTVELITNPGVEYDAEGRSVIIIKTKQKLEGLAIMAVGNWTQRKYAGTNSNLNINYTKDKITFYTTYNLQYVKRDSEEYRNNNIKYQSITQDYNSSSSYIYDRKLHMVNFGIDWNINEKQTIGAQYQGSFRNGSSIMKSEKELYLEDQLKEYNDYQNKIKDKPKQHLAYVYHTGQWSDKYKTNLALQYLKNTYKRYQDISELINNVTRDTINLVSNNTYDLYSVQQSNEFKINDNSNLTGGIEFNYISTINRLLSPQDQINREDYRNKETRWAGFVNYNTKLKNFTLDVGLRYEFEKLQSDSTQMEVLNRKTNKLYPNMTISTTINDWTFSLIGNTRTRRPSFSELNGNFIYIDQYNIQKGNPSLRNVIIYEVGLQATYKMFYAYLEFSHQKNAIGQSVQQEVGDNGYVYSIALSENFNKAQDLSLILNYNNTIGIWNANYTFLMSKPFFKNEFMGRMKSYNTMAFKARAFNDFNVFKKYTLSANLYYDSPDYWALTYKTTSTFVAMEFILRTSFLNDNLKVSVGIFDPFNMAKEKEFTRSIYYSNSRGKDINSMRSFDLTLTYKFNNYKNRSKRVNSSDINRF